MHRYIVISQWYEFVEVFYSDNVPSIDEPGGEYRIIDVEENKIRYLPNGPSDKIEKWEDIPHISKM